ncbi:hypothetical protein Tco_1057286 [Tanacetum coccineum]|uniref:Uncharacterized protein n=1 Tax=Tanacetum coccineum TaxID=301880 RepID=A0ABQ5H559_9ASTR
MWNAIKSRFGGNDESKKMQKYILKQQFEGFMYPTQMYASQKFLRSLPLLGYSFLNYENQPGKDSSFDDLYNYLESLKMSKRLSLPSLPIANKFYQEDGRKVSSDAKAPVGLINKNKVECDNATKQGILQRVVEQRKITGGDGWNPGNKMGADLERRSV